MTETLWALVWNGLLTAAFGDIGLLFVVLFIVFIVAMARLRVPMVPSTVIGIVMLSILASILSPVFGKLLLVLILVGGIALAFVFFKLGRF